MTEANEQANNAIESSTLLETARRLAQQERNVKWLLEKIDRIHSALCPDETGTWQMRAEQATDAAENLASNESK